MKHRTDSPLYGWQAPLNISGQGVLFLLLIVFAAALATATALLTLAWGPPAAGPVIPTGISRPAGLLGMAILGALTLQPRGRRAAISGIAVLLVLTIAPLHSPVHFLRTLVRVIRGGHTLQILTVVTCLAGGAALAGTLARSLMHHLQLPKSAVRGSTEWGRASALKAAGRGFLLGRAGEAPLRYDGHGHLLTIAATRSGKGVGSIVPNLLDHPGSLVVTDPKGENFHVTARYRREVLKQEVVALDPFGITPAAPNGFNPMDLIDLSGEDYVETAMIMADMIIARHGTAGEPHWIMEGKALLYTFILHAASSEDAARRNLIEVRRLLTLQPDALKKALEDMLNSEVEQVKEGAGRILQKSDRERSGVFSTAQSYTHFLSSPRMQRVLTATDFSIEALARDRLSLYLILPREHLTAFAPWLRLMISCCYHVCTHKLLHRERARERILFLLDEFANLGYMSNIKEAVSLGGGYGVTLWLILQDMAQLKREYRDEWESFVANSDVIQAFAIQDPFTSEQVARMLGQTTVWHQRARKAGRREGGRLVRDYAEESRPLLRPEELRRLHPDRQLLLVRPYQPVVASKIRYYEDPLFEGRFDPNPYFKG